MSAQLSFEIITPEGHVFQEDVYEVLLPIAEGVIGILPHHVPLATIIIPGVIAIRRRATDSETARDYIATAGGFVEIDGKRVRLLADQAQRAQDIDTTKVKEALARAQELPLSLDTPIEYHAVQLKVAELRRRHRSFNRTPPP
jgi:F-type H+-transporting ATPase subunit epsilon